jgi:hypothetical protein
MVFDLCSVCNLFWISPRSTLNVQYFLCYVQCSYNYVAKCEEGLTEWAQVNLQYVCFYPRCLATVAEKSVSVKEMPEDGLNEVKRILQEVIYGKESGIYIVSSSATGRGGGGRGCVQDQGLRN